MTLYELSEQAEKLYQLLLAEEIDEKTYNDTLDAIGADDKIDACCSIIQELRANQAACKDEEARLRSRIKMFENAQARIKLSVDMYLEKIGKDKMKTSKFTLYHTNSKSVKINDVSKIPVEFIKPVTEDNIKKSEILKLLKNGETVDGAELIEKKSLVVR